MNFVLRYLSTNGKDRMAELISTQTTQHPLPDYLVEYSDLSYAGPDNTLLEADVYRPKDTTLDPLPIVVFVHGGGFVVGSRKANRDYVEKLADRGYVVFVPEYRLLDESDGKGALAGIADVCASLSYLKDNAERFGGDLSRLFVIGESAGAFLAVYAIALLSSPLLRQKLAIEMPNLWVKGLACFGGMFYTSSLDMIGLVYKRSMFGDRLDDRDFMELMNPEDPRVEGTLPPVFQVSSKADFLRSYTLKYNDALTKVGHDHKLIYYKRGDKLTHAFPSLHPELPESKEVLDRLDEWFRSL
jgi:acetyl esterase/lipase